MLRSRGCADAGARSIGNHARPATSKRAPGQPGARCRTNRANGTASGSDLQRHVARFGWIDVARRHLNILGPQPCTDVELDASEYNNVREISGSPSRLGARTLRKILLALVRTVCALRKCARPGPAAHSGNHKLRSGG